MNSKASSSFLAISSAALLLPGLATQAETDPWKLSYQYSIYAEDSIPTDKLLAGSADRYEIDTHLIDLVAPLSESSSLNIMVLQESMSGASPWYVQADGDKLLQVMSGATIEENRTEINATFINKFKNSDLSVTLGSSVENDYKSFSGGVASSYRFNSWLTLNWGFNYSSDYIDASDKDIYTSRPSEESKSRVGAFMGASYAMGKTTLLGFTSSYVLLDGFLSDPYKLALVENAALQDSRPDSNQLVSNTFQIRQFVPSLNAAIHFDYRYFISDWLHENANTIDLAWYQNIGDGWMLIPSIRFYDQPAAYFYRPYYTSTRRDGYYSSDYRLSAFEATSGQIRLEKKFSTFTISISHETYEATGAHPGLVSYSFSKLGMVKTF